MRKILLYIFIYQVFLHYMKCHKILKLYFIYYLLWQPNLFLVIGHHNLDPLIVKLGSKDNEMTISHI